jgi:hypothetical protein
VEGAEGAGEGEVEVEEGDNGLMRKLRIWTPLLGRMRMQRIHRLKRRIVWR